MANPPNLHIFGLGRRQEHPKETHTDTGKMYRLPTDRAPINLKINAQISSNKLFFLNKMRKCWINSAGLATSVDRETMLMFRI